MRGYDDEYCYLTTTGRRTGRPHRIEIWFGQRDRTFYLLAGRYQAWREGADRPRQDAAPSSRTTAPTPGSASTSAAASTAASRSA
jgi:hypothetical protein